MENNTKTKFKVTFGLKDVTDYENFMEKILEFENDLPYSYYKFNKAGRRQFDLSFPPVTDEKELKKLSRLYSGKRTNKSSPIHKIKTNQVEGEKK